MVRGSGPREQLRLMGAIPCCFFGFEVSDKQTGEPLPDVGGHPVKARVAGWAGSVIDGIPQAADPPVIGHDQVRDVSLAGRPGGWLV